MAVQRRRRYARAAAAVAALLLVATGCDGGGGGAHSRPPDKPQQERWRIDYSTTSADAAMYDIAAAGKDDTWVIGQDAATEYLLLHRHGSSWRQARMPMPTSDLLVNLALDASAPDNVWMFADDDRDNGDSDTPMARRWDGHRWRTVPIDFSPGDVAVLAPDDVWALDLAGDHPRARHWNGRNWSAHRLPFIPVALSAGSSHDVWAVGSRDDPAGRTEEQPAAAHFDGRTWRSVPFPTDRYPGRGPHEQSKLTEAVAVTANDAWAFGVHYRDASSTSDHGVSTGWHWDGKHWKKLSGVPSTRIGIHPYPEMVATADGAGGFLLGGHQHGGADGRIRVVDDPSPLTEPIESSMPNGQATDSNLHPTFELNDLQRVPGTREVWAAGYVNAPDEGGDATRGAVGVCTLNG